MAEAFFLDGAFLLVTLIPIVSLIHMATCVPVHIEYFSAARQPEPKSDIAKDYTSALTIIAVTASLLLVIVTSLMPHATKFVILGAVTMYVSEKYFDEISRFFEFKKKFNSWFGVQTIRSAWLFAPILLAIVGLNYEAMFVVVSLPVLILALCMFKYIFKLYPSINTRAFTVVTNKVPYVLGSALSASCRQMPRVLVTSLFPSLAHVYVSIAQLSQVSSLIFAVKVVVPRRRVLSRKPKKIVGIFDSFFKRILFWSCSTAVVCIFLGGILGTDRLGMIYICSLLTIIFVAESLSAEILKFDSGLLPWFVDKYSAFLSYTICTSLYLSIFLLYLYFSSFMPSLQEIVYVPAINILLVTCLWRIIVIRHF